MLSFKKQSNIWFDNKTCFLVFRLRKIEHNSNLLNAEVQKVWHLIILDTEKCGLWQKYFCHKWGQICFSILLAKYICSWWYLIFQSYWASFHMKFSVQFLGCHKCFYLFAATGAWQKILNCHKFTLLFLLVYFGYAVGHRSVSQLSMSFIDCYLHH